MKRVEEEIRGEGGEGGRGRGSEVEERRIKRFGKERVEKFSQNFSGGKSLTKFFFVKIKRERKGVEGCWSQGRHNRKG